MWVAMMLIGTPKNRPVIVVNPRLLSSMKSGRPGTGGCSISASSSARFSEPTDRMRLATSPRCSRQKGGASVFCWGARGVG